MFSAWAVAKGGDDAELQAMWGADEERVEEGQHDTLRILSQMRSDVDFLDDSWAAQLVAPDEVSAQGHPPAPAAEDIGGEGSVLAENAALRAEDLPVVFASPLVAIVASYPWGNEAFRIVACESGFDPLAISWTGESFGLFQLNQVHAYRWPTFWSEWMIPEVNIAWAYELWLESGWSIWDCWNVD